ncbi:MAG TPA: hypothetical protein PKM73_16055 [Verrucomicrobiota bacterium]|nr:hypothetical protein [Verrucomicrobiota bacterium]HNU52863.1 hypothetical protein [Verrucomicrobiota bacterium]
MRLTRQEWTVLGLLAALLLVGWVVRWWREGHSEAVPAVPGQTTPRETGGGR